MSAKRIKLAVASATNSIRNKFKDLYSNRQETKRLLDEQYKPITKKLGALQKGVSITLADRGQNRHKSRRQPAHIVHSTLFKSHRKLSKKTPKGPYQIPLFTDDVISDSEDGDFDFLSADEKSPGSFAKIRDQINNERLVEISKQNNVNEKSVKKQINVNAVKNLLDQEVKQQLQNDENKKQSSPKSPSTGILDEQNEIAGTSGAATTAMMQHQTGRRLQFEDDDHDDVTDTHQAARYPQTPTRKAKLVAKERMSKSDIRKNNRKLLSTPQSIRKSRLGKISTAKKLKIKSQLSSKIPVSHPSSSSHTIGQGFTNLNVKEVCGSNNPCSNIITYWNDVNELVNRLRLLTLSTTAGHTGHNNEIIAIIEELREANVIE